MIGGGIPSSIGTGDRRRLVLAGVKASGECLKLWVRLGPSIGDIACSLGAVKIEFPRNFGRVAAGNSTLNNSASRNPISLAYCSSPFRVVPY